MARGRLAIVVLLSVIGAVSCAHAQYVDVREEVEPHAEWVARLNLVDEGVKESGNGAQPLASTNLLVGTTDEVAGAKAVETGVNALEVADAGALEPSPAELGVKLVSALGITLKDYFESEVYSAKGATCFDVIGNETRAILGGVAEKLDDLCKEEEYKPFCFFYADLRNITVLSLVSSLEVNPISVAVTRAITSAPCAEKREADRALFQGMHKIKEIGKHRQGLQNKLKEAVLLTYLSAPTVAAEEPPREADPLSVCKECLQTGLKIAGKLILAQLEFVCEHVKCPKVQAACEFGKQYPYLAQVAILLKSKPWEKALHVCTLIRRCEAPRSPSSPFPSFLPSLPRSSSSHPILPTIFHPEHHGSSRFSFFGRLMNTVFGPRLNPPMSPKPPRYGLFGFGTTPAVEESEAKDFVSMRPDGSFPRIRTPHFPFRFSHGSSEERESDFHHEKPSPRFGKFRHFGHRVVEFETPLPTVNPVEPLSNEPILVLPSTRRSMKDDGVAFHPGSLKPRRKSGDTKPVAPFKRDFAGLHFHGRQGPKWGKKDKARLGELVGMWKVKKDKMQALADRENKRVYEGDTAGNDKEASGAATTEGSGGRRRLLHAHRGYGRKRHEHGMGDGHEGHDHESKHESKHGEMDHSHEDGTDSFSVQGERSSRGGVSRFAHGDDESSDATLDKSVPTEAGESSTSLRPGRKAQGGYFKEAEEGRGETDDGNGNELFFKSRVSKMLKKRAHGRLGRGKDGSEGRPIKMRFGHKFKHGPRSRFDGFEERSQSKRSADASPDSTDEDANDPVDGVGSFSNPSLLKSKLAEDSDAHPKHRFGDDSDSSESSAELSSDSSSESESTRSRGSDDDAEEGAHGKNSHKYGSGSHSSEEEDSDEDRADKHSREKKSHIFPGSRHTPEDDKEDGDEPVASFANSRHSHAHDDSDPSTTSSDTATFSSPSEEEGGDKTGDFSPFSTKPHRVSDVHEGVFTKLSRSSQHTLEDDEMIEGRLKKVSKGSHGSHDDEEGESSFGGLTSKPEPSESSSDSVSQGNFWRLFPTSQRRVLVERARVLHGGADGGAHHHEHGAGHKFGHKFGHFSRGRDVNHEDDHDEDEASASEFSHPFHRFANGDRHHVHKRNDDDDDKKDLNEKKVGEAGDEEVSEKAVGEEVKEEDDDDNDDAEENDRLHTPQDSAVDNDDKDDDDDDDMADGKKAEEKDDASVVEDESEAEGKESSRQSEGSTHVFDEAPDDAEGTEADLSAQHASLSQEIKERAAKPRQGGERRKGFWDILLDRRRLRSSGSSHLGARNTDAETRTVPSLLQFSPSKRRGLRYARAPKVHHNHKEGPAVSSSAHSFPAGAAHSFFWGPHDEGKHERDEELESRHVKRGVHGPAEDISKGAESAKDGDGDGSFSKHRHPRQHPQQQQNQAGQQQQPVDSSSQTASTESTESGLWSILPTRRRVLRSELTDSNEPLPSSSALFARHRPKGAKGSLPDEPPLDKLMHFRHGLPQRLADDKARNRLESLFQRHMGRMHPSESTEISVPAEADDAGGASDFLRPKRRQLRRGEVHPTSRKSSEFTLKDVDRKDVTSEDLPFFFSSFGRSEDASEDVAATFAPTVVDDDDAPWRFARANKIEPRPDALSRYDGGLDREEQELPMKAVEGETEFPVHGLRLGLVHGSDFIRRMRGVRNSQEQESPEPKSSFHDDFHHDFHHDSHHYSHHDFDHGFKLDSLLDSPHHAKHASLHGGKHSFHRDSSRHGIDHALHLDFPGDRDLDSLHGPLDDGLHESYHGSHHDFVRHSLHGFPHKPHHGSDHDFPHESHEEVHHDSHDGFARNSHGDSHESHGDSRDSVEPQGDSHEFPINEGPRKAKIEERMAPFVRPLRRAALPFQKLPGAAVNGLRLFGAHALKALSEPKSERFGPRFLHRSHDDHDDEGEELSELDGFVEHGFGFSHHNKHRHMWQRIKPDASDRSASSDSHNVNTDVSADSDEWLGSGKLLGTGPLADMIFADSRSSASTESSIASPTDVSDAAFDAASVASSVVVDNTDAAATVDVEKVAVEPMMASDFTTGTGPSTADDAVVSSDLAALSKTVDSDATTAGGAVSANGVEAESVSTSGNGGMVFDGEEAEGEFAEGEGQTGEVHV